MPNPSNPPPKPSRGSNAKYLLIGLGFLGGAAALWMVSMQSKPPPAPAPTAPKEPERVNPMAQPDLQLEPEPPDAGQAAVPEPEPAAKKPARKAGGGDWDCSGDLPNASQVINENRAQIRSCYERRLKVNNVLQGDLRLKIKVSGNGHVTATQVSGSLHDETVYECVRNLASGWSFQVPTGGSCAVLQVPFQFAPKP